MLDGDDVFLFALIANPIGLISLILIIVVLCGMLYVVHQNEVECASMKCADGTSAVLMDNDCRCVSAPVSP